MITNPTIVTAIFDIGRDKWENYNLSYNTYLHWMRNLLLFDTHMVIYTESKFVEFIINHRKQVDPSLEKTIVEVMCLDEIDTYIKYFDEVKNLMENEEFKKRIHFQVPEMTKPLYNIIIFNKLYFIKQSFKKNHFGSNFFIWCDAGVLRDDHPKIRKGFPNVDKLQNSKNKITFFSHHTDFNTNDKDFHLISQFRYIHGGCFFVPNEKLLDDLIVDFSKEIDESIRRGYIGSEEKYFDFCYSNNKNEYNIVKSDWRQYFDIFG